ncbi:MAG: V-type ATP synthase subunit E family protein [Candidatus Caldarchaeales archaeon]
MTSHGLEKVIDEVVEKVIVDLESSFQELSRDVETLVRREREETLKTIDQMIEAFEKKSEMVRSRALSLGQVKSRGKKLEALEECVRRVVEKTLETISVKARRGELDKYLEKMLREAIEIVNVKQVRVYTSAHLREALKKIVEKISDINVIVEDEPVETVFGVVVKSIDGSISYDNRIESKLERLRPEVKKTIATLIS